MCVVTEVAFRGAGAFVNVLNKCVCVYSTILKKIKMIESLFNQASH